MNLLDILILLLLAVGVLHGYRSGFFKQAGGIAGVLIGFALGVALMQSVGAYLVRISSMDAALGPVVGFIAVFAGTYLLVQIIAKIGETALGAAKLGMLNRVAGGAVGGVKAGLFLSVAFLVLAYVQLPPESAREDSAMYHSVAAIMPTAWGYVSENSDALDELSRRIEEQIPQEEAGGSN